jgi:hypothetical protein
VATDTEVADGEALPFQWSSPGLDGEMGVFIDNQYAAAASIRSYVTWGTGPTAQGGRESTAVTAGLWTDGQRVTIADGHVGFVATGASNLAAGFTSVPAECFE